MKQRIKTLLPVKWAMNGMSLDDLVTLNVSSTNNILAGVQIINEFNNYRKDNPRPKVAYITKPFQDALISAQSKLISDEIWNTVFTDNGILVLGDRIYYYNISTEATGIHSYEYYYIYCFHKLFLIRMIKYI